MRVAIVSDIHGNVDALEAVLRELGHVDALWCLGDIVDLGPDPTSCVEILRDVGAVAVAGNHDRAAVGRAGPEFARSPLLAASIVWTRQNLTRGCAAALAELPDRREVDGALLIHDVTDLRPSPWIDDGDEPARSHLVPRAADVAALPGQLGLVGHFHMRCLVDEADAVPPADAPDALGRIVPEPTTALALGDRRSIANPGAVGIIGATSASAAYAVLEIGDGAPRRLGFHAAPFDPRPAFDRVLSSQMPPEVVAYWRRNLAAAALGQGDLADAERHLTACLVGAHLDERRREILMLGLGFAELARQRGEVARAARLVGSVVGPRAAGLLHPSHQVAVEAIMAGCRAQLGALAADRAFQHGRTLGLREALAEADAPGIV